MRDSAPPSLAVFSDPASVAVVGASEDPAKWGYWLAGGALAGADRRAVHLVNRRGGSLFGRTTVPSLRDLPAAPELVVLTVPAAHVATVVDEGLELGVRGFLGITANVPGEADLAARIRAGGARLVGPNSLGIYDAATDMRLAWGNFVPGPMAIVSQSGQVGSELSILGARCGVGVSRFVSIGNQSDVTAAELLDDLATHSQTRVIALYLEGFTDGTELFATLRRLREIGKPTLLLTVGASAAGSRLARSHTGSLTSSMDVVDAACRAAGVLRVDSPSRLVDVAKAFLTTALPRGNRVAVVGDSGGQCGIAADLATRAGLAVPAFGPSLHEQLAATLPAGASAANPVDLAGSGEQDLANYPALVETLVAADDVDGVVLTGYFGCYGVDVPTLADAEVAQAHRLAAAATAAGKPVLVHTMAPAGATAQALWDNGVPAYGTIDAAVAALAGLARLHASGRPEVPVDPAPHGPIGTGYWAARELLGAAGVAFPAGVHGHDPVEPGSALRYPVVLKAGWLEHKSELGGVVVGVDCASALAAAFTDMRARLGPGDYVVEEMDTRRDTVEMLIGARRDPDLGPVVVVGAGGTEAEMLNDVAVELAPVTRATADDMIARLRCSALLAGWRGRPAVDVAALAELVVTVSGLIAADPGIAEIEINPVRVGPTGALAVDALVVPCPPRRPHHRTP